MLQEPVFELGGELNLWAKGRDGVDDVFLMVNCAKKYNARLDFIEEALSNGDGSDPSGALPPASRDLVPFGAKSLNELALPGASKPPLGGREDAQFNGETAWLKDVPTEVLFAVLHSRAPPELGPPKLLNDTLARPAER